MRYWNGLLIAAAFDTTVIAGPDFLATEPPLPAPSQMQHLQEHVDDVDAMLALARL